jgi:hypothetical protein
MLCDESPERNYNFEAKYSGIKRRYMLNHAAVVAQDIKGKERSYDSGTDLLLHRDKLVSSTLVESNRHVVGEA